MEYGSHTMFQSASFWM